MPNNHPQPLPLCIDLDGTLVLTDTLWESCLRLLAKNFLLLFLIPVWLVSGKAHMKRRISEHTGLSYDSLPYNPALLQYITEQKNSGRKIVLVTAADQHIASGIAEHLDLFDTVLASDGAKNLSGKRKAEALDALFGEKGYVYAANASVDMAIWQRAAAAIVVNASSTLEKRVRANCEIETEIPKQHHSLLKSVIKATRPYQWVKNLLLFVPLILSHQITPELVSANIIAFISFCFAASTIYIVNDLFDLEADRQHDSKKHRPFASGALSIPSGLLLAGLLLGLACLLSFLVNVYFVLVMLGYLLLTSLYTLRLKRMVLIDVLTLTSLYTLRIAAGAAAVNVPVSYWLLTYSIFIFLSLGLIKRYIELQNLFIKHSEKRRARGYTVDDLPVVLLFGVCSGFASVLVMMLYINDLNASQLYSQPVWLWPVGVAVLYWINRVWLLAHRGELNEDPVLFAINDRTSYVVVLVILLSMYLAI